MNARKIAIIVSIAVIAAGLVYYKYFWKTFQIKRDEVKTQGEQSAAVSREVSAVAAYKVPDGEDKTRFILGIDSRGNIIKVKATDLIGDSEDLQGHLDRFSQNLELVIKGKKLSELQAVDRVGTSSLTTDAFNGVLKELKSQI